ncbi:MAG: hypothetical protein HY897_25700 [Deltaproteobacteria bacterium]|nr:hypothetical protein [Deltaproteobacteria bacterium]
MMTPEEHFNVWAPEDSPWSPWAKPVAFTQLDETSACGPGGEWRDVDLWWAPAADGSTALIIDLSGSVSVETGIALAERGFRPIPLFNNVAGKAAIVDMLPVLDRIHHGTHHLSRLALPPHAPPCFLLDEDRTVGTRDIEHQVGTFDNRWIVLPQDLPSGRFLRARGIRDVWWASRLSEPADDLAHVLRGWQDERIGIWHFDPTADRPVHAIAVERPRRFRLMWYRALAAAGLRRNSAGGFGSVIPQDAGAGGFG